jgi:Leucine-rich repeat (LRR) protein
MGGKADFAGDRLKAIDLSSTSVSDAQLSYLSGLTNLEKLDLQVTQVGDLGLKALEILAASRISISVKPPSLTPAWRSWPE